MRHEHSQKFANCPSDHHWQFEPHIFPPLVQYFSACKVPPETVNYGSIQPADLPKCSQPCSLCLCHQKHCDTLLLKTSTSRAIFQKILLMLQKSQTITWDASKTTMNIGRYLLLQDFFHQMAWRLLCRISVFCLRQHKGWHLRPLCEVKVQQIEKKRFHMPIRIANILPGNKQRQWKK